MPYRTLALLVSPALTRRGQATQSSGPESPPGLGRASLPAMGTASPEPAVGSGAGRPCPRLDPLSLPCSMPWTYKLGARHNYKAEGRGPGPTGRLPGWGSWNGRPIMQIPFPRGSNRDKHSPTTTEPHPTGGRDHQPATLAIRAPMLGGPGKSPWGGWQKQGPHPCHAR